MARRRRPGTGRPGQNGGLSRSGGFVGMGGLAVLAFLYLASFGFLPWWNVAVLILVWGALAFVAARWFTPRPVACAVLPVAGVVAWLVFVLVNG